MMTCHWVGDLPLTAWVFHVLNKKPNRGPSNAAGVFSDEFYIDRKGFYIVLHVCQGISDHLKKGVRD